MAYRIDSLIWICHCWRHAVCFVFSSNCIAGAASTRRQNTHTHTHTHTRINKLFRMSPLETDRFQRLRISTNYRKEAAGRRACAHAWASDDVKPEMLHNPRWWTRVFLLLLLLARPPRSRGWGWRGEWCVTVEPLVWYWNKTLSPQWSP